MTPPTRKSSADDHRNMLAGAIGNAIEFYDFMIYAYLAPFFAVKFFPSYDPVTGLIATYGGFAAGMLMRPVGGMLIGNIGDRIGRALALQLTVLLISVPTFLIGLLPGYDVIGLGAPLLLVLMRMVQGLSLGGEYSAAVVFLVERAPPHQRGFSGSFSPLGATLGFFLGSAVVFICVQAVSPVAMYEWGWRIPFLASALLTLIGFYVRRGIAPDERRAPAEMPAAPVREALKDHWREMLAIGLANAVAGVMAFVGLMFIVTWSVTEAGVSHSLALMVNLASLLFCAVFVTLSGKVSDQIGWKRTVMIGATISLFGAWPAFMLVKTGSLPLMLIGALIIALAHGLFTGPFCACMAGLVPQRLRVTVIAFGYSMSMGIFGGLSPMLSEYLVGKLGFTMAPALMVSAAALVSLMTMLLHPVWRKSVNRLPEDSERA
jgi:MHS family proline/betaine transporter-like MFS transporter